MNMLPPLEDRFYSVKEVLSILGISIGTYKKRFPFMKGKSCISRSSILNLMSKPIPPKKIGRYERKKKGSLYIRTDYPEGLRSWVGGAWGKRRTFSCKKWGFEEARSMAEATRDEYLIKFKPKRLNEKHK